MFFKQNVEWEVQVSSHFQLSFSPYRGTIVHPAVCSFMVFSLQVCVCVNTRMYIRADIRFDVSVIMLFALFCDLMFTGLSKPIVVGISPRLRSWWWNAFFLQPRSFPQCDCIVVCLTKFLEAVWKVSHIFFLLPLLQTISSLSLLLCVFVLAFLQCSLTWHCETKG